jgi:hypothetical protein
LLEVGTHWVCAILEILGYDTVFEDISSIIEYPDGEDGTLCENKCVASIRTSSGALISIDVDTASSAALQQSKDIYELQLYSSSDVEHPSLTLFDFVRLRDGLGNTIETSGDYGRQLCCTRFLEAVTDQTYNADIVTYLQAFKIQQMIENIISTGK